MTRIVPALLALTVFFVSAAPAAAQSPVEAGTWTATPFLSLTFGGDGDSISFGLGGAAGRDLTDRLGVEVEGAYVFDLAGDSSTIDWSVVSGAANVLYYVPFDAQGLAAYATGGIGVARAALSIDGTTASSTEVGFNLGGGVKAAISDAISARGDLRYINFNDAVPDGWRLYGGLTWRLGR